MGEVVTRLLQLEDKVSSPLQACVSAVEKLIKSAEKNEYMFQKILDKLNFLCTGACVRAIRRRRFFVGSAQEKWNMLWGKLIFPA